MKRSLRQFRRFRPQAISPRYASTSSVTTDVYGIDNYECAASDIYTSSSQRWLWNESRQLKSRYVKFDLESLLEAVQNAVGNNAVSYNITKKPESSFGKVLKIAMVDGREAFVKIPNSNVWPSHFNTASQVATMSYVRDKLHLPVPKVLDYCTRADNTKVGAEYIIMEKAPGVEVARLWKTMKSDHKILFVKNLAEITAKLSEARFSACGSLYFRRDLDGHLAGIGVDDTYAIGPIIEKGWFDEQRREIDVYRGPWSSPAELVEGFVNRETACLNKYSKFPSDWQIGIYGGPGGYNPTTKGKLAILDDFLKVLPHVIPKNDSLNDSIIWHDELDGENILVDEENPSEITGIVDWQAIPIYPMFLDRHQPEIIDHEWPKPDTFVQPKLPENISELEPEEKKKAKERFLAEVLWALYDLTTSDQAPDLRHAFRYRNSTIPGDLLKKIKFIFNDWEPSIQCRLAEVTKHWGDLVDTDESGNARVVCPLNYSQEEMDKQDQDLKSWQRDIDLKIGILNDVGFHIGIHGETKWGEHYDACRELENAKERFLDRESRTPEERKRWEELWPFRDHNSK